MAGTDGAGSIYALRTRIARLSAAGDTPAAASGMYTTDAIVKVDWKIVMTVGDDIEEKNGSGIACVVFKTPDTLKRYEVTLQVCTPDEELEEILGGGTIITTSGNTIGYQVPAVGTDPMPNGISLEFWSRAVVGGSPAATNPYRWWAMPRAYLRRDDYSLDSGVQLPQFSGYAIENSNWGNGPNNDWHDATPTTYPSNRILQRVRTSTIPNSAIGYQAIPTQV